MTTEHKIREAFPNVLFHYSLDDYVAAVGDCRVVVSSRCLDIHRPAVLVVHLLRRLGAKP